MFEAVFISDNLGRDRPLAPRDAMRAVAFGQCLGFGAFGVAQNGAGQIGHGLNVFGNVVVRRTLTAGAQDQTEVVLHLCMADGRNAGAFFFVLNGAAHVDARRAGGHDGIAALEQNAVGDRNGLGAFSVARDLHQHRLTGAQALGLT